MINELDQSVLFELAITPNIEFHLQRITIITWKESPENLDDDRAISFQELDGVKEVWEFLCRIKGRDSGDDGDGGVNLSLIQSEDFNNSNNINVVGHNGNVLPEVTIENLPFIAHEIQTEMEPSIIKKINEEVIENNGLFIKKLGELLENEEKNNLNGNTNINNNISNNTSYNISNNINNGMNYDNLSYIFIIFKNLFLIANRDLIELLVSDNFYNITFGALEYDLESQKKISHRNYFKDIAKFKNILNIDNSEVLHKIHLNHRLSYLRDTAIGRFIEELPFLNINVIIQTNNAFIIQYFLDNKNLLKNLIINLNKDGVTEIDMIDNLMFILELIGCMKEFQQKRVQFHESLVELGFLDTIEVLLQKKTDNKLLKSNIVDILVDILTYVPYLFKEHIMTKICSNQASTNPQINNLLFELCEILTSNKDFGIKYEIGKIIMNLLDNEIHGLNTCNSSLQKTKYDFYNIIFDNCLNILVNYLSSPISTINDLDKNSNVATKQIIIEILCYCLSQHGTRIQYWLIQNNVLTKILNVLNYNQKILHLQVVKYIKSIILNNDYNFTKVIMSTDCFGKIIYLFNVNKKKNNLIFSAILDLFQMLKNCSHSKKLINYLFENYSEFVYDEKNKIFFEDIISLYENQNENDFGFYNNTNTVSHINKEGSDYNENNNDNDEANDPLAFIGLFSKAKTEEVDFDFENDNNNNFLGGGDNIFLGNKRNNEEKFDELIKDLKKQNEEIIRK